MLFWNWPLIKEQQCLAVFDACASHVRRSLTCCFSSPLLSSLLLFSPFHARSLSTTLTVSPSYAAGPGCCTGGVYWSHLAGPAYLPGHHALYIDAYTLNIHGRERRAQHTIWLTHSESKRESWQPGWFPYPAYSTLPYPTTTFMLVSRLTRSLSEKHHRLSGDLPAISERFAHRDGWILVRIIRDLGN